MNDAWLKLVEKTLAGAPLDGLTARTSDGLAIKPLSAPHADARPIAGGGAWRIVQRINHPDPAAANVQALEDLNGGATGLAFVAEGAASAYGFGATDLKRALEGVHLDLISLRLEPAAGAGWALAQEAADLIAARGVDPARADVSFGLDPLRDSAPEATRRLRELGFRSPIFCVDGRPYHAAGASEGQELAAVLATALAYLRALDAAGMDVDGGLAAIGVMLTADGDQLLTIAKFRAMRLLWARLSEEIGARAAPARIEAETAWRDLSRRDPQTNMLRGTIAAFSAGVAGADAATILPFTQALGLADAFARRMARNAQSILMEEASLHRIADPAAGAGSFEDLTESLAEKAWDLFREIERRGGMAKALESRYVQGVIAESWAALAADVAEGRRPLVGTSVFAPAGEEASDHANVVRDEESSGAALKARRLAEVVNF